MGGPRFLTVYHVRDREGNEVTDIEEALYSRPQPGDAVVIGARTKREYNLPARYYRINRVRTEEQYRLAEGPRLALGDNSKRTVYHATLGPDE